MAKKLTFSVDDATAETLKKTAYRLRKSQSLIVREAVAEYAARAGRLTEQERREKLEVLDAIMQQPSTRSRRATSQELRQVRQARRQGGRRHPAE